MKEKLTSLIAVHTVTVFDDFACLETSHLKHFEIKHQNAVRAGEHKSCLCAQLKRLIPRNLEKFAFAVMLSICRY